MHKTILLCACNAKYIHSNPALYSLKAYAAEYQDNLPLREFTINQLKDEVLKEIYQLSPSVICFSCYIWNIEYIRSLLADLKQILPDTDLWVGGPEVSFDAEDFLKNHPQVKGVMIGEGEKTFFSLCRYYLSERKTEKEEADLNKIRGITFRDGSKISTTGWPLPLDMDDLPFPYSDMTIFENRIVYYESSRGCPFSCSYCLSSIDKALRFRSLDLVFKDLQFFLDQKLPQVKFIDRTFNCNHHHAYEIWKYLLEHDNGITNFHFEISADLINEEELLLMQQMRPGLIQLEIGVQSTNPDTIRDIHRTMKLEKLKAVVERIHSFANIHQHLDLIAGLPDEDYGSFRNSFNEIYALKPDQLQLGFLKFLKGSDMMNHIEEYGMKYHTFAPYEVFSSKWLTYGQILKLKEVESVLEIYYNSGQFVKTLEEILPGFESPFAFYEALGSYYQEKGLDELSHSRIRRYGILLDFIREKTRISEEKIRKCMIYDLYARENLKKRPEFAPLNKEYEPALWQYRKENRVPKTAHIEVFDKDHIFLFDYNVRDPLTNNADVKKIEIDLERKGDGDIS